MRSWWRPPLRWMMRLWRHSLRARSVAETTHPQSAICPSVCVPAKGVFVRLQDRPGPVCCLLIAAGVLQADAAQRL